MKVFANYIVVPIDNAIYSLNFAVALAVWFETEMSFMSVDSCCDDLRSSMAIRNPFRFRKQSAIFHLIEASLSICLTC